MAARRKVGKKSAFDRCVDSVSKRGGVRDPKAVCGAMEKKRQNASIKKFKKASKKRWETEHYYGSKSLGPRTDQEFASTLSRGVKRLKGKGKRNPAAESVKVYEEFHGHAPSESVVVTKRVHTHAHLAAAGQLKKLVVLGVDKQKHVIQGFKGALLAFNERKNQLFVEGGDQSINLDDYGIKKPHELETLGRVKQIEYHADKHHLGDEGGNAVYSHKFRTTNEDGEHIVLEMARYPDLVYDVVNEQFLFSGGSYTIRAEGIDV